MIGIIYKAKNMVNGKEYIGQTIQTLYNRRKEGYGDTKFGRAIKKYGKENFEYTILWEIESKDKIELIHDLNIIEEIEIGVRNLTDRDVGYNTKMGGFNGSFRHTEEAKRKIGARSRMGTSSQFKRGHIPWTKGRSIVQTDEHKKKVSEGLKKAYASGSRKSWNIGVTGTHKIGRSVENMITGKIYVSMSEASDTEKDSLNTVLRHCQKKATNPRWRYIS